MNVKRILQHLYIAALVVWSALFFIPNTVSAVSNSIVISEIQTGGSGVGTASQEFVELYNNSDIDINVTGWKLVYVSASGSTQRELIELEGIFKSKGFVLAATTLYSPPASITVDATFSAGLAADGGHLRIIDVNGTEIDRVGWGAAETPEATATAAPAGGSSVRRLVDEDGSFIDTDNNHNDFAISPEPEPIGGWLIPVPINPDPVYLPVTITEILSDPASPLTDEEDEFIELFNPNSEAVNLKGYILQTGANFQHKYTIPDVVIDAGEYKVFYSKETNLTLANAGSKVRILNPHNESLHELEYLNLGDGIAWAFINSNWQQTNNVSPGSPNVEMTSTNNEQSGKGSNGLGPCPTGKFRNPATNRCKNIETSTLGPCPAGKFRNPETNRCKSFVAAATSFKPCQPGQERNPLTNRCRKIGSGTLAACKDGYERNTETNRCRKLASVTSNPLTGVASATTTPKVSYPVLLLVTIAAAGYGLYEYRFELANTWAKIRKR